MHDCGHDIYAAGACSRYYKRPLGHSSTRASTELRQQGGCSVGRQQRRCHAIEPAARLWHHLSMGEPFSNCLHPCTADKDGPPRSTPRALRAWRGGGARRGAAPPALRRPRRGRAAWKEGGRLPRTVSDGAAVFINAQRPLAPHEPLARSALGLRPRPPEARLFLARPRLSPPAAPCNAHAAANPALLHRIMSEQLKDPGTACTFCPENVRHRLPGAGPEAVAQPRALPAPQQPARAAGL